MYILYLDDSGSVHNLNEAYLVLGGVAVPEQSIRWLSHQVELLVQQIDPNNPEMVEFHAAEIFGGRTGYWKSITDKHKRIDIIKNVLGVMGKAYPDITTFACAVHKKSFPTTDPVIFAFEELSSRFDLFLQRKNIQNPTQPTKGMIVLDKSSYENNLQTLASTFRRQGNRWGSYLKNICEVPLFVDSTASRLTQLADHIAYAVFRRYHAFDINYYNIIEGRFDKDPEKSVIHGLVHKQTYNPSCTCPACITRR